MPRSPALAALLLALLACDRGGAPISPLVADAPRPPGATATAPAPPAPTQPTQRPSPAPTPGPYAQPPPGRSQPAPPPAMVESPPRSATPLALRVEATVRLQPERAQTSGNNVEGTVAGVAFLGERSEYLVGGGNDDRVHLAEIASGRERWASPRLGKDVQAVAACGDYFAGLTYEGRLAIYRHLGGGKVKVESTRHAGGSHWLAFTPSCDHILTPDFLGELYIYERASGGLAAELPADGYRNFATAGDALVYRRNGPDHRMGSGLYYLYTWAGTPARGRAVELPYVVEDDALGLLVQIQPTPWGGLVREYCDRTRCRVILEDRGLVVDFAVAGGVWTGTLGSRLAISSGGEYLAWYRDGLPVEIVELASGQRAALPKVARTMSSTVDFAFDPRDPRRLAVAMHPAPNMVTVYRLGEGP